MNKMALKNNKTSKNKLLRFRKISLFVYYLSLLASIFMGETAFSAAMMNDVNNSASYNYMRDLHLYGLFTIVSVVIMVIAVIIFIRISNTIKRSSDYENLDNVPPSELTVSQLDEIRKRARGKKEIVYMTLAIIFIALVL